MRVHWTVFQQGDKHVEGQIWEPDQATDKVILFCPGYPGMGALHFEQRHVAALVQAGFAVVVLRHNGTRLDSPSAPAMVNNAARLHHGRTHQQTHLGGGPSGVRQWLNEPWVALQTLDQVYKHIYLWGSSFGAVAALWSLTTPGAPLNKVRQVLLVAGAQGVVTDDPAQNIMRIWKAEFMTAARITDKTAFLSVDDDILALENAYKFLPDRVKTLPEDITLTAVVVQKDEIVAPDDAARFNVATNGRCQIVIDEIDRAYPDYGLMAHDMPDYPTENFFALIKE